MTRALTLTELEHVESESARLRDLRGRYSKALAQWAALDKTATNGHKVFQGIVALSRQITKTERSIAAALDHGATA